MKLFLILALFSLPLSAESLKTYTVVVTGEYHHSKHRIKAPSDRMALDAVLVGAIYHRHEGSITRAEVLETSLSTDDFPTTRFIVRTEEKTYPLNLRISDPEFVLTMIQASRHMMSKTATREVLYGDSTLKSMPPVKFVLKLKNNVSSFLLNTNDPIKAKYALEVATLVSKHRENFLEVTVPSLERAPKVVAGALCAKSVFN